MSSIDESDVGDFIEKVDEVSRLIEGLSKGTISPEYVDTKLHDQKKSIKAENKHSISDERALKATIEHDEDRQARLSEKALELKTNYERRLKARARFDEYVSTGGASHAFTTDYTKWDMWCPEDDEDDLINSITPNSATFRAMEKDIDDRHRKMVESRQIAERMRVKGNTAFKDKQYTEALRCYQVGIEVEKTNVTLHTNAAQAALKINCYVQAIEHCDKALHISDFMLNSLKGPLCTKAYQRRAAAYRALQQYNRAVQDLECAIANDPTSKELQVALSVARRDLDESQKQKQLRKAMAAAGKQQQQQQGAAAEGNGQGAHNLLLLPSSTSHGDMASCVAEEMTHSERTNPGLDQRLDIQKLRKVEELVQNLQNFSATSSATHPSATATAGASATAPVPNHDTSEERQPSTASSTPKLPERKRAKPSVEQKRTHNMTSTEDDVAEEEEHGGGVKEVLQELNSLLEDDDMTCVYFRECGGLSVLFKMINSSRTSIEHQKGHHLIALYYRLLTTACHNDMNLLKLPESGVLTTAVQTINHQNLSTSSSSSCSAVTGPVQGPEAVAGTAAATAAAAVRLLCTASTSAEVRPMVSRALGSGTCLEGLFRLLLSGELATKAVVLMLLGNSMMDAVTKDGMKELVTEPSALNVQGLAESLNCTAFVDLVGSSMAALIQASRSPLVQERALTLLGNMCGDAVLRQALLDAKQGLVKAAVAVACSDLTAAPSSQHQHVNTATGKGREPEQNLQVQLASATFIYNVAIEPKGQEQLLQFKSSATTSADATFSNDKEEEDGLCGAVKLLPLLDHDDVRMVSRAAGILARCCKHPLRYLRLSSSLPVMMKTLNRCNATAAATAASSRVRAMASSSSSPEVPKGSTVNNDRCSQEGGAATSVELESVFSSIDALTRALALLTQQESPEGTGSCQQLLGMKAVETLLEAIRLSVAPSTSTLLKPALKESILGNACLCLSHLARLDTALTELVGADAVKPLVQVAHEGKGSTASKNAAIALARMSRHPKLLERLRELHGVEIIYQYVRP
ncbi:hypothetical protein CEUSTIGMA_g5777.t1 [Chlamydomonas eustigma]|uniref:Uncharacterized protein n=1 Tax=Chlamydomonas eustigma TaxID=1157962 RepID=A0A250X5I1_9CHLO|nr:hypothetical protein CEUSTIGMA_g5777.t1 [Chlamydomonas eustigma]|eukprot:GAX78335.1 hypothetical protein CEUSTIGMA_g5777.t1 [Chlamydomonas eustigma]